MTTASTLDKDSHVAGPSAAVSLKCDVRNWEDQVALFDYAISTFGSIDVVVSRRLRPIPF